MEDLETSKKAFVIGARETVRGFHLIGVPGEEVNDPKEAAELLEQALSEKYSLIIISASIASEIQDIIDEYRIEKQTPIIVVSDVNLQVDKRELEEKFKQFIGI